MGKSRTISLVCSLVVCLLVTVSVVRKISSQKPNFYSDPDRVVGGDFYDRVTNPDLNSPTKYDGVLDSITVQTNESSITLTMPSYRVWADFNSNPRIAFHQIDLSESYESESGRIWIEKIAVAYGTFPPDKLNEFSVRFPAKHFDRNLVELTPEEVLEAEPEESDRSLDFQGRYPAVQFLLRGELQEEAKLLGFHAFNTFSRVSIANGYSVNGKLEENCRVKMELQQWHNAPVEFVADIALGPVEVFEFTADQGARFQYPEGEIKLIAKTKNMDQRSTTENGTTTTVKFQSARHGNAGNTATMIFASLPKAQTIPVVFEFLDANGRVLQERGEEASGIFLEKSVLGKASDVKTVRLKYYPNRKRLIFKLPGVPGLPAENQHLENLFDVHIPFLAVREIWEYQTLIWKLTHLSPKGNWPNIKRLPGREVFYNITMKDLVDKSAMEFGPNFRAVIDQEAWTIEFLDMSIKARGLRLWEKTKSFLR